MVEIIGVTFTGPREHGDFAWMLAQAQYDDALFVFNDNEGQFRAFRRDPRGAAGCSAGGGNAAIRPYRCQDPPRAAGIPTGDVGGYPSLDDHARAVIDEAIGVIRDLLATGRYQRVLFSAAPDDPDLLGTGIFHVGQDVRRYVVAQLRALGA
jgi:acetyl esterase/lipase